MKFVKASKTFYLNKSTYINLRWIAIIGQLITILSVEFLLNFKFNYIACVSIISLSILTNVYLQFKFKENQLNNSISTIYLIFDILLLGFLFFLTARGIKFHCRSDEPRWITIRRMMFIACAKHVLS